MSDERSDEQLIDAVLNGERSAFGLLFRRYQYRIAHAVMKYVHEQADVNDVVQESFIKAYRALPDFRGSSSFYSWIYRIAINCAKNFAVSHGSRAVNSFDVDAPETESYDSSEYQIDKNSSAILAKTKDAGKKYVEATVFVGDSNTVRMNNYGLITLDQFVGQEGMGVQSAVSTKCKRHHIAAEFREQIKESAVR